MATSTVANAENRRPDAVRAPLAWLPIPVFVVLLAAAVWIEPRGSFEPRFLLPVLNVIFITGICLLVATLAARSYVMSESVAVLLLGCGTLSLGLGSAVAAAGVLFTLSVATTIAATNLTTLISGGCFLASAAAMSVGDRLPPFASFRRLRLTAVASYMAVIAVIVLLAAAEIRGALPAFFVPGYGAAPARQAVLGAAVVMFVAAAVFFRIFDRHSPSPFIRWYSLSLVLIAVGIAGFFTQRAVGGLVGWIARTAHYVGCIYMFVAVQSLPRTAHFRRILLARNLRETERRHRTLVDLCPDAILVSAEGKYVFANPAAARLFGARGSAAIVGRSVLDLVHPDFRPLVAERIRQVQGGQVASLHEMRWLRLDGTVIDVEATGAPVQFRGRPAIQTVVRDVSKRKQLENELRASEGLLRAITDHTTDAVYVKDRESRWLMANPALLRIVDRPAEQVLGLTDAQIYSDPAIGEAILANDRRLIESGQPMAFEEAAETPEGVRWFLSTKAPMRDATKRIVGIIGISRDITERRRMEEALREADRRKTEFIAMLSHELRNPLAPIRYALPLIGSDHLSHRAAAALAVVSRQVDHLVRLVDDLLDVSRITRGQIDLRREPVMLESVVKTAVESASPLIDASRHALVVRLPDELLLLDVDPDRVSQIITNLLTNAARYTPPGGEIHLEAAREDGRAVIRVTDNGIGIAPEILTTLFEMFYQAKPPDRSQGGLGIGLALAKRLTEMHGGTIEARSAGVGHGAEFIVRLPLAEQPCLYHPGAVAAIPANGRRLKILIVDDNLDLVEMLAIVVGGLGHDVRKATDGPGALFVAKIYRPDVVLLDLGLPGLSGIEVARELRANAETAGARLVALTGLGQEEDRRRTREAGFDHHLTKPTEAQELERLLADLAAPSEVARP